ncbi:hypothetical protein BB560_002993, partial [Smittium megazygosporum]
MVRFKNRYVCFQLELESEFEYRNQIKKVSNSGAPKQQKNISANSQEIDSLVKTFVNENFGDYGSSVLLERLAGIARVPRDNSTFLCSMLVLINKFKNQRCRISIVHVSGTIKKCQQAAIKYDRSLILQYLQENTSSSNSLEDQ